MKSFFLGCLIIWGFTTRAQKIQPLDEVAGTDSLRGGYAVVYGNFIQRLGFTSGGFPQDIRIQDVQTKEIFSFRVKPVFKSAKANVFCDHIKPGTYILLNYWYTESKWYGGKMFTEQVSGANQQPFIFTIKEGSLNYTGNWHFNTKEVFFSDDKAQVDIKVKEKYRNLNFNLAITTIPAVSTMQ